MQHQTVVFSSIHVFFHFVIFSVTACEDGQDSIVRALLVFEADANLTNEKNETPWQVAFTKATTDSSIMDSLQSK